MAFSCLDGPEAIVEFLRSVGVPNTIEGCSPDEVAVLEEFAGGMLPAAYRNFLLAAGRRAGSLFSDLEIFFPAPLKLRGQLIALLRQPDDPLVSDSMYFFGGRMQEQFSFFHLGGCEDPEVFFFYEWEADFSKRYDSFTDFLLDELNMIAD